MGQGFTGQTSDQARHLGDAAIRSESLCKPDIPGVRLTNHGGHDATKEPKR